MSDIKISQLPAAATVNTTDIVPLVHAGTTYQASAQQIYDANRREGKTLNVAADGTAAVTITFTSAFPTALLKLDAPTYFGYTGTDVPVFTQVLSNITAAGFTIEVYGGQIGTTISFYWGASGN